MASIEDVLLNLFQGAGVPAEEAANKVAQYAPLALKAGKDALGPLGSLIGESAMGAGKVLDNVPPEAGPAALPGQIANLTMPTPDNTPPAPTPPPIAPPVAPVAPEAVSPTPAPKVAESLPSEAPAKPQTPPSPMAPTGPSDNDARNAALADAEHRRKMAGGIGGAIAGLGDTVGSAARGLGVNLDTNAQERVLNRAKTEEEGAKADIEKKISNDPNSEASRSARELVLQIAPQMAQQPNFSQMSDAELRNKLPLVDTMMKAKAAEDARKLSLEQLKAQKEISLGEKQSQFQDRAVNQAITRVASIRGDQSLARTENQRDAASSAYTLLQSAKNEKRPLTQPEYYDLLGQLWQARTGRAPTTEAMRDLDAKTFQGNLNKVATYFSGKPAGATTQAALDNLQQFVVHTGNFADSQHDAYMAPHYIKPAGVSDEAWAPVKAVARGRSFADAMKSAQSAGGEAGGRKTAGGYSYTVGQ